MMQRAEAAELKDVLLPLSRRRQAGPYFLRVCAYSDALGDCIWQVHEAARQRGVIIEGQIANPDEGQLRYLSDVLGTAFEPTRAFVEAALQKWVPQMSESSRRSFAEALCAQMAEMKKDGKSDSILKNVYVKMMCWLYYRFLRLMPLLEQEQLPKVLYEGSRITAHELMLLRMLCGMGADIILLETQGDGAYLKHDPESRFSQCCPVPEGSPFPAGFSLKSLRRERAARPAPAGRPASASPAVRPPSPPTPPVDPESRFPAPRRAPCTNAWMQAADYSQLLTPPAKRGQDSGLFYNALIRLTGVKDKTTYLNGLYQFYQALSAHRRVVVADGGLTPPGPEELQRIRRGTYRLPEEMIVDLAGNLPSSAHVELQRMMQRAFARTMKEEARTEPQMNRLTVTAAYVLCWIWRYQAALFGGWKEEDIPVFIKTGGCETRAEAAYLRYLSLLPVDVMILAPDLGKPCLFSSSQLLEITGAESMELSRFPRQSGAQMRTLAAHAEQDMTDILYTDSGMYRSRQFRRADTIILRTTYDEIFILWDQELKYRPNFSTADEEAHLPVIFAKVSGVEGGNVAAYWQKVKKLAEADHTLLFRQFPLNVSGPGNPFRSLAVQWIRDGRLRRQEIQSSRQYPFGLLRPEMQEHILDKVQQMLDQRVIRGTFVNGTEYTVLATALNMGKELIRLIQGFDFTQKNPKLVAVNAGDCQATLEDAIWLTLLSRLGFDVAVFVPTGYQTVERYLDGPVLVEHQAGPYVYDLIVPDFSAIQTGKGSGWLSQLLRRGR